MATKVETAFIKHLTDSPSMRAILDWNLPDDLLPTEALRPIHAYALRVWDESGGTMAPSVDVMEEHFGNELAEAEINIREDAGYPIQSTIHDLRSMYVQRDWSDWVRGAASDMAGATVETAPEVLGGHLDRLLSLHTSVSRVSEQIDLATGASIHEAEYLRRVAMHEAGVVEGAIFGLDAIDTHTSGIKPGELAVLGGTPKSGKSWMLLHGALHHWRAGGEPVLYTLENAVQMAMDRLVVLATGVDSRRFQHGTCHDSELDRIRAFWEEWRSRDNAFHILQPERGQRTMEQMIRRGRSMGDALYIDQLTFVESGAQWAKKQRWEQIGLMLHDCKSLITSGERIPCVLAHQINREGQKAAEKVNRLEMYHFAEGSEVERTADWAFGLWQSRDLRDVGFAQFQSLASRREDLVHWEINWRPWMGLGQVRVRAQITLEDT